VTAGWRGAERRAPRAAAAAREPPPRRARAARAPPRPQRSLWEELAHRSALLGGGPGLVGRRCFVLDAPEAASAASLSAAAAAAAAAAAGTERGAPGRPEGRAGSPFGSSGGGCEGPGGAPALAASAWVGAEVAAWDEERRLLLVRRGLCSAAGRGAAGRG
jgi:hypothetical protein